MNKNIHRNPGQSKLSRYRHTQSCIRVSGFAPTKEREKELLRCRVMGVMFLLLILAGTISIFR